MDFNTAERLAKLRKERGLSQEELAECIGVSRQAVSKWERGESSPDTSNLIALATLYGVSIDELLDYEPERVNVFDEAAKSGNGAKSEASDTERAEARDFFTIRSDRGEEVRIGRDGLRIDDGAGARVSLSPFRVEVKNRGGQAERGGSDAERKPGEKGACSGCAKFEFQSDPEDAKDGSENRDADRFDCGDIPVCTRGKNAGLSPRVRHIVDGIHGAIFFGTLAAFLLWGFLGGNTRYEGDWGRSWLALFAIPVLASLTEAFAYRDPMRFAFPVLVAAAYLAMGLYADLWQPGWAIFFSIPLYYMIADPVKRALSKR